MKLTFKIDAIESHSHVSGHEKDTNGHPDLSKPTRVETKTLRLSLVACKENAPFWPHDPAGGLNLSGILPSAVEDMALGQEITVNIEAN